MSNWVEDFNSFQGSQGTSVAPPGKVAKKSPTKAEQIEAELKLLEWHKMANDAAMKAALVQTKSMKSDGGHNEPVPKFKEDDKKWMRKVINDENARPLEVSRDFVLDYERREKENSERLAHQVESHIHTLRTLRGKLEQRADLKSRTDEYREFQRDFRHKKNAILEGKTVDEYNQSKGSTVNTLSTTGAPPKKKGPTSDLSHVLNSLSRLSELENRISKLESGNMFDNLLDAEQNPKIPETVDEFDFKKKRTMGNNGKSGMRVVYSVQPKKGGTLPRKKDTLARGGAMAAVRQQRESVGGPSGGTFLTGVAEENNPVEERRARVRREQQLKLSQATSGQKSLRSRVLAKKTRGKEQTVGRQRHEEAMAELQRRKQQLNSRKNQPSARAAKGASAGIHTKNKHMQEFNNMKAGFNKRKEAVAASSVRGPARKLGAPGMARVASRTAPGATDVARRNVNPRGAPTTKTGGTVTRKLAGGVAPTRRPPRFGGQQSSMPETAPPAVSVSGIKGIRSIRKKK